MGIPVVCRKLSLCFIVAIYAAEAKSIFAAPSAGAWQSRISFAVSGELVISPNVFSELRVVSYRDKADGYRCIGPVLMAERQLVEVL